MKNHEFIYEFMKKPYDLGCTKKCAVKRIFTYEFIYEFILTHVNSYMISCLKINSVNSYMNSNMNSYIWILNIWIHIWIHTRINIIWLSGCSKYGDQGVPDPSDDIGFGFGVAAAVSRWVSEAGCGEQRRAAAPSEWEGPRRVPGRRRLRRGLAGCGKWRRASASDYCDGLRQVAISKVGSAYKCNICNI